MIIKKEFERISTVLGLNIPEMSQNEKQKIDELILNREKFREEKKFDEADKIRNELNIMNIELIDHKERTIWMKKEKIKSEN